MPFLERAGDGAALLVALGGWEPDASEDEDLSLATEPEVAGAAWSRRLERIRLVIFQLLLPFSTTDVADVYVADDKEE